MEINEIKGQITSITSLTSTDAFSVIENKIPDISDLVKKADYDTKKNQNRKKNFLLLLIIINLQKVCLMQRKQKKDN